MKVMSINVRGKERLLRATETWRPFLQAKFNRRLNDKKIFLNTVQTDYLNSFFIFFFSFIEIQLTSSAIQIWGFPGGSDSKESACNAGDPVIAKGSGEGRQSTEDFQGSETILHNTVMVDT